VSGTGAMARQFVEVANQYAAGMPVWMTEAGYDINQGSAFKAIAIGNKTPLLTQADWILRSALLYARSGIERIFFYGMYDDNEWNAQQFSSSGLINQNRSRKPAADYLLQARKLLGEYVYQETTSADPIIDRYALNGKSAYVVFIGDEKGRTLDYTLDLRTSGAVKIYTPKAGSDTMDLKTAVAANGSITITATETPQFIIPSNNQAQRSITGGIIGEGTRNLMYTDAVIPEIAVQFFPNPIADRINFTINNKSRAPIELNIYEAGTGIAYKKVRLEKSTDLLNQEIDTRSLPGGNYLVEIRQGNYRAVKKLLKLNNSKLQSE
jgi:endoglucanase